MSGITTPNKEVQSKIKGVGEMKQHNHRGRPSWKPINPEGILQYYDKKKKYEVCRHSACQAIREKPHETMAR